MSRVVHLVGIAVGLFAVFAQFGLAIGRFTGEGLSILEAAIRFFSYFTILTNIFVVLVHAAGLSARMPGFFRRPNVVLSAVVAITVVGIVYHFLLAQLWNPQGLQKLTDVMLHYAAPLIMLVWWVGFGRTGTATPGAVRFVLIYPLVYLGYVLVRAPIAGEVPYPFLDYWQNGWTSVLQMIGAILALFFAVSALAVATDRYLPLFQKQKSAT